MALASSAQNETDSPDQRSREAPQWATMDDGFGPINPRPKVHEHRDWVNGFHNLPLTRNPTKEAVFWQCTRFASCAKKLFDFIHDHLCRCGEIIVCFIHRRVASAVRKEFRCI